MLEVGGVSVLLAFAAGLLSVLSPCVLPLVPIYLGYLTGASLEATGERAEATAAYAAAGGSVAVAAPTGAAKGAPSPLLHSLSFVAGFTAVFVGFGLSVGLLGYILRDNQDLILKAAGTVLIVLGLHLSGVITIPFLDQERRLDVPSGARVGYARSFLVGSAFSAGWSPCMGPTLAAIFALAISGATVLEGGVLLLVYSAGLSVPFVGMGLAYNGIRPLYQKARRYVWVVNYLSGAMLIVIGILIFTDSLINLNELFNFGFLNDISTEA